MKMSLGKAVFAVVSVVAAVFFWGCAEIPYLSDCRIVSLEDFNPGVEVVVRGSAAEKLLLILIDPDGHGSAKTIEKGFGLSHRRIENIPVLKPKIGVWLVEIRTPSMDLVGCQEIAMTLESLSVKEVKPLLERVEREGVLIGYKIEKINISVEKVGSLPLKFFDVKVEVEGEHCLLPKIISGHVMVGRKGTVELSVCCPPSPKMEKRDTDLGEQIPWPVAIFRPGDKGRIRGTLFFGESDSRHLEFDEEFCVPSGNVMASR